MQQSNRTQGGGLRLDQIGCTPAADTRRLLCVCKWSEACSAASLCVCLSSNASKAKEWRERRVGNGISCVDRGSSESCRFICRIFRCTVQITNR